MRLYLTQHGLAVPPEVDRDRPLSLAGREDVRRLAAFLQGAGVRVHQVLHSGKTRAEQTAALLAEVVLPAGRPQVRPGLGPNDPVEPLSGTLAAWSEDALLVGHLPFLGRLASLLLLSDPARPMLAFQPGTAVCLERDSEGRWSLGWMLPLEHLVPARG
mgnify:CR=1 FL=1